MITDFSELRLNMVDCQLRTTNVTSLDVLSAFLEVPREAFVPSRLKDLAYLDEDLEVAAGRYVMEPAPLARLIQLAAIKPGDVVLDAGCATGYSSAILSRLATSVIAVESDEALAASATESLLELGYDNVAVVTGPINQGYAAEGPYDVILVGGAVDEVSQALFAQLRDGGRLVVVEGHGNAGAAKLYLKDHGAVSGRRAFNCAVRPLPGFAKEAEFQF
ncbi:MAG: protein-L-isoaspartate O-methyltransferase [Notoacmeibacter sp.]|nr:protein-L-isoaspartate O-methyltransferase [Notoacmeibacter sp.]MCC0031804.1 protein-L-isoaspartate O-methyltransferase [Brucellaceae bacterium]